MKKLTWAILTGEYPPQPGGVSDYTRLLARGLAETGDEVHVWTPVNDLASPDESVHRHVIPDQFGLSSLALLDDELKHIAPCRILVQYVPQAFGWSAMNLPFCLWLQLRRRQPVWIMFHEAVFPFVRRQPIAHAMLAIVTRMMAASLVCSAAQIFVSIPGWTSFLPAKLAGDVPAKWLPIFSNLPTSVCTQQVAAVRKRIVGRGDDLIVGHFGTYGRDIANLLSQVLPTIIDQNPGCTALLMGQNSDRFADELVRQDRRFAGRINSTGILCAEEAATHLAACDLLLQPYPDGASSRRGSLMAGLALGVPILTTHGRLTESLWRTSGALAMAPVDRPDEFVETASALLTDRDTRRVMGGCARELYASRFSIERTIAVLRNGGAP